jgi:hypothetical protein
VMDTPSSLAIRFMVVACIVSTPLPWQLYR